MLNISPIKYNNVSNINKNINNYRNLSKNESDTVSFKGLRNVSREQLNKYKFIRHHGEKYSHAEYFNFANPGYDIIWTKLMQTPTIWYQTPLEGHTSIPWKLHVYADNEEDWQKLVETVGVYLNDTKACWKTLGRATDFDTFKRNHKMQMGKAFTIYPDNKSDFRKIATDIDYIIRLNHMEVKNSSILGDRKLGDNGRLFYRYEHKSKATKDNVYNFKNPIGWREYESQYDGNRGGNNYLAADMKPSDDPFLNFDPNLNKKDSSLKKFFKLFQ